MADKNTIPEEAEDKKAAKKAAKEAKRAEKAAKKAEKRRKQLEKAGASPEDIERALGAGEDYEEEGGGSRLAVFLVTIVIIAIWLAILALLVKMDVGGFGSTVLKPLLEDVPYVNRILPETDETEFAKTEENTEQPYATLDEAVARIKALETELQNEKNARTESQNSNETLKEQTAQLEEYKAKEAEFEALKQKFDEEVVFSDQAPDINAYKEFYESIDPANAEAIYKRVLEQQQKDEELEKYVSMYSSMKPKQAAAIFDTMTKDLNLVAQILKAMDTDASSSILGAMNAETAAKLTKIMNPSESK